MVTRQWHFQHDAGRPFAETSAELIAAYPAEAELIRAFGARWLETFAGPTAGTHAIVQALADAQVPQFAITNFSAEFWQIFQPTAPILQIFRDVIISGREHLVKPDPAIFALARQRFALGDGDAVFIDDNAANVDAARDAGWHGIHFRTAPQLRRDLRQLGFAL